MNVPNIRAFFLLLTLPVMVASGFEFPSSANGSSLVFETAVILLTHILIIVTSSSQPLLT